MARRVTAGPSCRAGKVLAGRLVCAAAILPMHRHAQAIPVARARARVRVGAHVGAHSCSQAEIRDMKRM